MAHRPAARLPVASGHQAGTVGPGMVLPDDYDSSDEEVGPQAPNPYETLGEGSIAQLVERSAELRVISKRNYKSARNVRGSVTTVEQRARWGNRFESFAAAVNTKITKTPTGEDIHRFMDSMVQISHSRYKSSSAMSYSWFHGGLKMTIDHCKFKYADFKLTGRDGMLLDSLAANFLKNGILTKDPFREKQWLGARVVERCVSALLSDALINGTLSWDVVICRAASLVLVSCLGRAGDVVLSSHYTGKTLAQAQAYTAMSAPQAISGAAQPLDPSLDVLYCICFEDVTIKLESGEAHAGEAEPSFVAYFNMRQDKGRKGSRGIGNRVVTVHSQKDPALNIMDPVKYVLILALRFGAVNGTTIEEVVKDTARRQDKTVQWARPKLPILLAFRPNCVGIVEGKAARAEQVLSTLRLACELAGMIFKTFATHDMRRGLARDIAYLPGAQRLNTTEAAEAMNHTDKAVRRGTTKDYIGPDNRDSWSARVANDVANAGSVQIQSVGAPFKRRKHTAPADIRRACDENGLDYANRNERERATSIIRHNDMEALRQRNILGNGEKSASPAQNSALKEKSVNVNKRTSPIRNADPRSSISNETMEKLDSFRWAGKPTETSPQVVMPSNYMRLTGHSTISDQSESEQREDAHLSQMAAIMCGAAPSNELENMLDPILEQDNNEFNSFLEVSPMKFIESMSRINVVCHSQPVASIVASGGSRDKASRFLFPCPNSVHGCDKSLYTTEQVRIHLQYCKATSAEAWTAEQLHKVDMAVRKDWHCALCNVSFTTKGALTKHDAGHNWVPKRCEVEGCKSRTLFKTLATYNMHQYGTHAWEPCTCPIGDCGDPTHVYPSRTSFRQHLQRHGLTGKEASAHMPQHPSRAPWVPITCLFPGCTSPVHWRTRKDYRGHLYETHKVHGTGPYMPS